MANCVAGFIQYVCPEFLDGGIWDMSLFDDVEKWLQYLDSNHPGPLTGSSNHYLA